jgi:hypothetical protein
MVTGTARTLEVGLSADLIIAAIKRMKRREREEFIEDLLASTSPDYLDSIREARSDKHAGRTKSLAEVFGA